MLLVVTIPHPYSVRPSEFVTRAAVAIECISRGFFLVKCPSFDFHSVLRRGQPAHIAGSAASSAPASLLPNSALAPCFLHDMREREAERSRASTVQMTLFRSEACVRACPRVIASRACSALLLPFFRRVSVSPNCRNTLLGLRSGESLRHKPNSKFEFPSDNRKKFVELVNRCRQCRTTCPSSSFRIVFIMTGNTKTHFLRFFAHLDTYALPHDP